MLNAETRENIGKGAARALRREGKVPAVIYGGKEDPVNISVPTNEILKKVQSVRFMSQLLEIQVGKEKYSVLPKEVEMHPVTDIPEHLDFLRVDKNTKVKVMVPVKFLNKEKCIGIKRGGTLNIVRHEIEFLVTAYNIPSIIEIDIANCNIGDSVHIESIEMPEGAELTIDRNFTIATIAGRTAALAPLTSETEEEEEEGEEEEGEEETEE